MPYLQDSETRQTADPSIGPDHYGYRQRLHATERDWITIDKTTALILRALASAALAVTIAAGTALVGKLDETVKGVEKERAERIASFGDLARMIGIVETKVEELIIQANQLDGRMKRNFNRDLDLRDRKLEDLKNKLDDLDFYGGQRRFRQPRRYMEK